MIRAKLKQITDAVYSGALARFTRTALPVKTAFRLREMTKQINSIMQSHEETKKDLVKKYEGVEDPTLGIYKFASDEVQENFSNEYADLISTQISIAGDAFKLDKLPSSLMISVEDLELLSWLIDVGQPEIVETKDEATPS